MGKTKSKKKIKVSFAGVTAAKKCNDGIEDKIVVQGTALRLRGFGFPITTYRGFVAAGTDVPPVPSDSNSGGILSGVDRTDCQNPATGTWCTTVPFVPYGEEMDPGVEEYVNITLWHYYQNPHEVHVLVEQCRFRIDLTGAGAACPVCSCP